MNIWFSCCNILLHKFIVFLTPHTGKPENLRITVHVSVFLRTFELIALLLEISTSTTLVTPKETSAACWTTRTTRQTMTKTRKRYTTQKRKYVRVYSLPVCIRKTLSVRQVVQPSFVCAPTNSVI